MRRTEAGGTSYGYDGFGNLWSKTTTKGSAPGLSVTYDRTTNRQYGVSYDANGDPATVNGAAATWDVENRLGGWTYDPWNRRVLQTWTDGEFQMYGFNLYTSEGQLAVTVNCQQYLVCSSGGGPYAYIAGKRVTTAWSLSGMTAVTDRLGSVRVNMESGYQPVTYYPYGEANANPLPDGSFEFGTYLRDGTGLDYANQRYYSSTTGSFWTPDPLGASAADPTDPNSWNMYAYAGGDPINFNDPDGTTACGDLQILGTGMSLSQAVTGGGDTALLADLVWAESDHTWSRQGSQAYYNEQDAVAWTVENRWKILNGYLSVAGVPNPSTLGWGPNGASISQIIGWSSPTQFSTITGGPSNPQLRSDLQSTLSSVLAGSPTAGDVLNLNLGNLDIVSMTHECFDVWQSYVTASFAVNGTSSDPFASQGYTTSFHHGTNTTSLEGYFGNFGDANNFFGIAKGSVTVNPTPVLPRPRPRPIRPPGPRPPGGGRRGPL